MMWLRRRFIFAACIGALLPGAGPAAAAPRAYAVVIDKMKYGPLPSQLHKGDAVVWMNRDFLRHTVTATDHSFDVDLPAGAKGKTVMTRTGVIPFVCRYHPGMRGTLVVK
jgi:plastocyanin